MLLCISNSKNPLQHTSTLLGMPVMWPVTHFWQTVYSLIQHHIHH